MSLKKFLPRFFTSSVLPLLACLLLSVSANAQAPSNDDCSGAIVLNVDTVCHYDTFNNINATASVGVPSPGCGFYQGGDVWFKTTVPSSGNIRIDVRNVSGINPQFAIYTDSCSALTWYSCNQLNPDRTISDPSLAGQDIYIRVYKYNSASGGTFRICVWEPPVPANNNCADAIFLNVDTTCNKASYTSLYSTGQPTSVAPNPTCGFYKGGDVWFKFVMPASGIIRFELTGQAPQYAVYSGSCGSFTQILCAQLDAENMLIDTSLAGDTLYLRTYRYNSEEGGNFDICIWEPTVPSNNNCADAIMLNVDTTCNKTAYSNAYATGQSTSIAANPTCGFYQGGDVWFKFVAPASGIFRVEAQGFGMNPQYAVYSGSCGSFTQEMCAQLDAGKTVINPSLGGDTLYLRVWNYNTEEGGNFEICVWEPEIPANDNCADAIWLNTDTVCNMSTFTNAYASAQPTSVAPNPNCGFYKGGDVWFKFVMPASGNLRVEKQNLGANAQYAVYSGSCGSFTQLFCAQLDAGKTYIDTSVAGDTLYLRVYNYNVDEGGGFGICVFEPDVPVNNNCSAAIPLAVGSSCIPSTYTNRYATADPSSVGPNPTCGFYKGGDVWFTVQMPSSGLLTIQRQNLANVNAQMALYSGVCDSFTQLACAQLNSTLNYGNTSLIGQTLYLRVYNYNSDEGGEFTLCAFNPSPVVTTQPNDTSICGGDNANFDIVATNATGYQWQEDSGSGWNNISNGGVYSGATSAVLSLTSPPTTMNGYQYRCVVSGIVSPPDTSNPATLTVGTAPQITASPTNVLGYTQTYTCNAYVTYAYSITGTPNPHVTYSLSGATTGGTIGTGSGRYYGVGVTTVKVNASNLCGADSNTHTVTVTDTLKPVIYCSAGITVNTDSAACSATAVNLLAPSVVDACGVDTLYNNAPSSFPKGATTVVWTAVDNNGNTSTCTQDVTVRDTTAPTVVCPSAVTVPADNGICSASNVILSQPSVFDVCGIDTIFNNAPTVYPFGNTVVTFTVKDTDGNTSTCATTVTVTDTQPPVISAINNMTVFTDNGSCTASNVILPVPSVTDNCSVDSVWDNAPAVFPLGNTIVTVTATDHVGLQSTTTYNVIVQDVTAPSINAGPDLTISAQANCGISNSTINWTSQITATDNCTVDTIYSNTPQFFSLGTTAVVWTAVDGSGNTSTDTVNVTIIDTTAPNIVCPTNITVNAGAGTCSASNVNLGTPVVTDNCATSVSNNAPSSYPVGTTSVLWTAIDGSGNTSSCVQTVTVIDNQPPVASCKNHSVTLVNGSATISVSDINNNSTDNCGIGSMSLSQTSFTTADIGNNTVTLTVTDVNGNTSTCTGVVTVQGAGGNLSCSIAVTPNSNTYTGGNPNNIYLGYGPQSVTLTGAATGGSGYSYSWSGTGLSCTNCQSPTVVPQTAGTYVFTLTVTDNTNSTTSCNVAICVQDIRVAGKKNKNKVYVCHNGNSIKISTNAVAAHLNNHTGDFLGRCYAEGCNSASKGRGSKEEVISGLQEITQNSAEKFMLYPNPNDGTFKLQLPSEVTEGHLVIMDMLGKVVKKVTLNSASSLTFNMSDVADGVYMVEVKNGDAVYRKRMMIKR